MDLVELAKSLGKDIPDEAMKTIAGMTTKAQVLMYCRRFPMATKAAPKKAAPKPVKADEEE
tara:strand:+ start:1667 stop:1849 length:183 start_codon:yes stop_codon:yes gene_type:complete